jgi:hypothetical protein
MATSEAPAALVAATAAAEVEKKPELKKDHATAHKTIMKRQTRCKPFTLYRAPPPTAPQRRTLPFNRQLVMLLQIS